MKRILMIAAAVVVLSAATLILLPLSFYTLTVIYILAGATVALMSARQRTPRDRRVAQSVEPAQRRNAPLH
ncbi:hypothetical protein [Tropicimonas isoalkanivorans]|uniref:Uncharacterized protein n=1 Tax=Tropicimonas isoalkanivorans TaxID=441112 RepID=A0A1I1JW48_9RHOB|nr:hypothetical protein [Tropicimonas isoalkanivorans]SFC50708.1 hypothetical protein SAMN04488094_105221 [Tropicimonas isoalkanivorans]